MNEREERIALAKKLEQYEFIKEENIKDLKSTGLLLKHKKTGARIVILSNEDDNKVFSIGFRTPPADSTGVAHIVEHTVLCGSEQFPAKDPFVELVKGSLNTFLNAMTYPDKTIYPVASYNDKDFQNLMHVYLDAVFYPNIYKKEEIFKQEGWHYELDSMEDDITYNGVVYNEMKGVFSSPEQQLYRVIQQSLFPDTAYGTESGGEPKHIPELSYEQYLEFHRRYYHPSNSYIYLYGDMDVVEKLTWIDENYLSAFEALEIDSTIQMQKPFESTMEITEYYYVSEEDDSGEKTFLSYNVVVDTSLNKELYLAFDVLDYVLFGAPGAPVKQALLDAGIGKDILSSYDNGILQPVFSVIAKNAKEEQKEEFIKILKGTLQKIVKEGLDETALRAGINYHEFRYREADFGSYPKGLMYGIQILDSWLYDDNKPFIHLNANETFAFLKEQIGTGYYENLIEKYFLENSHSTLVTVVPKKGLTDLMEQEVKEKLESYKKSLSKEELEAMIADTKALKEYQETPSTKEELEKIPMLERQDIKKEAAPLYNEEKRIGDTKVIHHNIYTNGIGYLKVTFPVEYLLDQAPYLSLLDTVLGYMDTEKHSFLEFSNEVNLHTGGMTSDVSTYVTSNPEQEEFPVRFEVKTKVLYENLEKALELMQEMIFSTKFENEKRLKEIISETKSRLQMKMVSAGHTTAMGRAASYFSKSAMLNEQMNGLEFYRFLEDLEKNFDSKKDDLIQKLKQLCREIFVLNDIVISYTADDEGYKVLEKTLPAFLGAFPSVFGQKYDNRKNNLDTLVPVKKNEGLKTSGQIQYVARAGNFIKAGLDYTGALRVLKVILSYDYLWNNIRVKGGAYGCMCGFAQDGNGYFVSYRDPGLKETDEVYAKVADYVETFTADEREMTKYIIGTISSMDTPLTPSAKGARSFAAYLGGFTLEKMQKDRDAVLEVSQKAIQNLAPIVRAIYKADNICVIGNENKIKENAELFMNIENLME